MLDLSTATKKRLALAFVLSLAAAVALQRGVMLATGEHRIAGALAILVPLVMMISAAFAVLVGRRRAPGRTAGIILAALAALALGIHGAGVASVTPGLLGDLGYVVALALELYVLLPAAVAVPLHWLLLRRLATPA